MFDKILVPIDGSKFSKKALQSAVEIAKVCKSKKVVLLNVYEIPPYYSGMKPGEANLYPIAKCRKDSASYSASILEDGEQMAKDKGLDVEKLSVGGHITEAIVRAAEDGKFDLIVLGHKGRSNLRYLVTGHVCEGVLRHAPCPVLVIK